MPTRRWRTLLTAPDTGVANMALDAALMEHAERTGEWVCRVYAWREPTVSFGRNQAAVRHYDRDRIAGRGFGVVRRPTGGRAILHHREVTYAVAAPAADAGGLHESYLLINRLLVDGLRSLGVDVSVAGSRVEAMQPGPIPCFDHPSSGELVAGGRKLVGSAQWRSENALLQHGSILIDDDQGQLTALLREPVTDPPPAATLRELLGTPPSLTEVADAIFSAVRSDDPSAAPLPLDQQLLDSQARHAIQFRDAAWTWRR
ncbi:MAG TPA: lipoate--protein ligase family protein [Gemmatimonadaceae bacterium]|nr:lipoate--protein ligase family protein [Gemmatimonadaceae bacterium]